MSEFPLTQFMVTIANGMVLAELEAQRERELAEARAIQVGMLPHGRGEVRAKIRCGLR